MASICLRSGKIEWQIVQKCKIENILNIVDMNQMLEI